MSQSAFRSALCCLLMAAFSGANDAGRRDAIGHVVHEWRGLVERERRAEIGSCFLWRLLQTRADSTASINPMDRA